MGKPTKPDHEQRIVEALEEIEDDLEAVAETNGAFSDRAQNALDWLDDHRETDEEGR